MNASAAIAAPSNKAFQPTFDCAAILLPQNHIAVNLS